MKKIAERIFRETLAALDIRGAIEKELARTGSVIRAGKRTVDLTEFDSIVAIAFGKAAFAMADGLTRVLSPGPPTRRNLGCSRQAPAAASGLEDFRGRSPVAERGELCRRERDSGFAVAMR